MRAIALSLMALLVAACVQNDQSTADAIEGSYGVEDVAAGAEFRFGVHQILTILEPSCPLSRKAALLAKFDPVKERFDEIGDAVSGTVHEIDIAIARADRSRHEPVRQCIAPDLSDAEANIERAIVKSMALLDTLESISIQRSDNEGGQ